MKEERYQYVDYQVDPHEQIATVTFSNPDKNNAAPFWAEEQLVEAIDDWEQNDDVKVVILRGAGDHFSAGHDAGEYLSGFKVGDPRTRSRTSSNRELLSAQRGLHDAKRRLFFSLKPTIAEIRGQCLEWGNQIQVCCDISIASTDAHLGNLAQPAGMAGINIIRLYAELVGFKRMRELMIAGRTWSGHDAAIAGLVNRAVAPEQLQDEVWNEARRVAQIPLDGIVTGKYFTQMVYESMGLGTAFTEMAFGYMGGLRMRLEEGEVGFFEAIGEKGIREAVLERKERYAPLGGFGPSAERPIVPEQ